ncbi:ATP-binding protein [uncultured Vibrio sp.]|uniref:AAA family ATPase n=1 Tax=uncultured Vibrio sp. TaxID=114054 RepID=UPI002606D7AC|nr:ATP-binding protein [uncultured Vibrio sp.]
MKLILIRGLPGSGKSTKAKTYNALHLEADMYFVNEQGDYCFDPWQLGLAHEWCQNSTENGLKQGLDVVVSNTFIKQWEMKAYRQLARKYKAELIIEVCREQFGSIHNIEPSVIKRMARDWQE